ncbi:MAG: hypothetical protein U1A78_23115 [Polyangia bacterium]
MARAAEADSEAPSSVGTAPAEPPAAAAAGPIALLGVFTNARPDKTLRDTVFDRLTRLGEEISLVPESADSQDCKQVACYADFSLRHGAPRILRVDVYESTPRRYYLEAALYDQARGSARTSKGSCDDCSSENLRAVLGDLTARLVAASEPTTRLSVPPESPPLSGSLPLVTTATAGTASPSVPRPRWTSPRIALVAVLSALTAATLLGTVVMGTRDVPGSGQKWLCTLDDKQRPKTAEDLPCISRTQWAIGGGVLTGLSAAGLALTLQQILRSDSF